MNRRAALMALVVCAAVTTPCFAADLNMGTWKLNEAKSTFSPGASKNRSVVYDAVGDNVKVTVDGVDSNGQPIHNEWTGKFDGQDYPVTGDPNIDVRSYRKVDDRTLAVTQKKGGKVTTSGRIVVAVDGKTRTVTTSGTNPQGQKINTKAVYEKQ